MRPYTEFAGSPTEPTPLLGLRISGGLLVAFGCLWGFYGASFAIIQGVVSLRARKADILSPSGIRWFATPILSVIVMSAFTWLCMRAGKALYDERRWGAYIAMAFGLLLLLFSGDFIYDLYHPEQLGPEGGFFNTVLAFHTAPGNLVVCLPQSPACQSPVGKQHPLSLDVFKPTGRSLPEFQSR
jgi:hypothetical protein